MKLNRACLPLPGPELIVVRPSSTAMLDPEPALALGARPESARKIEQSIAYMRLHLNGPLQVARLAAAAHTSPSHFFVLFKRWTGASPIEYFIRLRMRQACQLLGTTDLSVKEIAAGLGYEDPFYFSRVFKSVHGVAPSDYRHMLERAQPSEGRKDAARPFSDEAKRGIYFINARTP